MTATFSSLVSVKSAFRIFTFSVRSGRFPSYSLRCVESGASFNCLDTDFMWIPFSVWSVLFRLFYFGNYELIFFFLWDRTTALDHINCYASVSCPELANESCGRWDRGRICPYRDLGSTTLGFDLIYFKSCFLRPDQFFYKTVGLMQTIVVWTSCEFNKNASILGVIKRT